MQQRVLYLVTIAFLFGGANLFISTTNSQTTPFTMGQVLRALASINDARGAQKRVLTDRILADIRRRKVDFQLTGENEDLLREEGATSEFIEAIRQSSRRIPTPTPTATPARTSTRSNTFKNSIGIEFVRIPAGTFMMGSPTNEPERGRDEKQHRVTISRDFYMGRYEVTQAQWRAVIGNNPSSFKGDNSPVENVSWNDAQEFIKRLNAKNEGRYRLPTEAEWEYAACAGKTVRFGIGDGDNLSSDESNFDGNFPYGNAAKGVYVEKTTRVGNYPANDWGLYDMHGNVWEWVQDWYGVYPDGPVTDPTGPSSGEERVRRGGSFVSEGESVRCGYRQTDAPSYSKAHIGFRIARD